MTTSRLWVVIPAAGQGKRAQGTVPKQYWLMHGQPVLTHTLKIFLNVPNVSSVLVGLHPQDTLFQDMIAPDPKLQTFVGDKERYLTIYNALLELESMAAPHDWVLVHDAARPCLHISDLNHLIDQLIDEPVGGILGTPVSDTLKWVENDEVKHTVSRVGLWQAQTPQMFRLQVLLAAYRSGIAQQVNVTDDASFIEMAGLSLKIVPAQYPNPKLTYQSDLPYLQYLMQCQNQENA